MTDHLTYAIGDVHGEKALLVQLLADIERNADGRPHTIVTLGDYCDRGPDTRGVLDVLMSRPDIVALLGNHDELMLRARSGGRSAVDEWVSSGGISTCASFGALNVSCIPEKYFTWIREKTRLVHEDARRVYVHAGVAPGTPSADRITELVATWISKEFLYTTEPFFKYVVHGHTPTHKLKKQMHEPELLSNRCNLDTGAFRTGVLTAGVFDDSQDAPIGLIRVTDARSRS